MNTAKPTLWLTGLSRSGKTTIAEGVADWLTTEHALAVQVLDGRFVREELGNFFGYSREERVKVGRVLATMAGLLARNGVIPIVTAITPHEESRAFNRSELDPYLEIYIECPVEVCMDRDSLGLYRKAQRGDLPNYIGVDVAYEIPKAFDLSIATDQESPEQSIRRTVAFVSDRLGLHAQETA